MTVVTGLLIVTVLYQAPIAEIWLKSSDTTGFLVHSWDLAWLLLVAVAIWWVLLERAAIRSAVDLGALRGWPRSLSRRVPWRDPITYVVIIAAFAFVSLIWTYKTFGSSGFTSSVVQCLRLASVILLALLIRRLPRGSLQTAIVGVFLLAAVAAAAWAFVAWRTEHSVYDLGLRVVPVGITRAGGPFGNEFANTFSDYWWAPSGASNVLGFWLAIAIPVSLLAGIRTWETQRISAVACFAGLAILVAGLLATQSRESWVACAVVLAVLAWPLFKRLSWRRRVAILGGLLLLAAVVAVGVPSVRSRIDRSFTPGTFEYTTGPLARTSAWKAGLRWSWERFPIGWGIGTIEEHPADFQGRTTSENIYIQYLAQLGVIGFLGLVAISVQGIRMSFRRLWTLDDLPSVFAACFFVVLVIHGMFGYTLGDPTVQILLACALGFAAGGLSADRGRRDELAPSSSSALPL